MFIGLDMTWFFGVVEDRFDPLEQGRYRVRVMGYHTAQKSKSELVGIPTDELLWFHTMTPTDSASMSGIGHSPTNLVEGTHVLGFFRDPMLQDGIIVGTLPGSYVEQPDTSKGFCDPFGMYPRYIGNDVNILAGGGQKGEGIHGTSAPSYDGKPTDVYIQDENTTIAVAPDDRPLEDIPVDDDPNFTIEKMLKGDEGYKTVWYIDSEGYPTIGIGHLIIRQNTRNVALFDKILSEQLGHPVSGGRISPEDVTKLFTDDLNRIRADMIRFEDIRRVYVKVNRSRQMALENMSFQMGAAGLNKFKNTLNAMYEERWVDAQQGILNSLYARQTPGRANRIAKIVLTGNLESYGVMVPQTPPIAPLSDSIDEPVALYSRMTPMSSVSIQDVSDDGDYDPSVPPEPRNDGLLFDEPTSSYAAQYPYNHVYESESGHVQEFDDTPGHERYHLKHPSGTFVEVAPNGQKITKVYGDDYELIQQGKNLNIKGDWNVVVEGKATIYVMGDMIQQVDGNLTQTVRGNVTETIQGNAEQHVFGDVNSKIDGNMTSDVALNLTATVQGNCNQNVEGDMSLNVFGDYDVNVLGNAKYNANESIFGSNGTTQISGSTININ